MGNLKVYKSKHNKRVTFDPKYSGGNSRTREGRMRRFYSAMEMAEIKLEERRFYGKIKREGRLPKDSIHILCTCGALGCVFCAELKK